jgi:hypothetical protein
MGQPWGLSGPQFLGVYAAALAAVIIVLLSRRAVRSVPGAFPATELSPGEVGYLTTSGRSPGGGGGCGGGGCGG